MTSPPKNFANDPIAQGWLEKPVRVDLHGRLWLYEGWQRLGPECGHVVRPREGDSWGEPVIKLRAEMNLLNEAGSLAEGVGLPVGGGR